MTLPHRPLDLAAARECLSAARGPEYWRCLEELAQSEGFDELLQNEFPRQAAEWADPVSRRQFLTLMGASLALAGLGGCAQAPREQIMPYVRQPEEIVPGKPLFYATAMPLAGYANGLLVESHLGRPTKVEGNPQHPASPAPRGVKANYPKTWGPTNIFAQASVLTLYDPDRSQTVKNLGDISSFDAFVDELRSKLSKNVKLRILTETVTSPTLARQLRRVLRKYKAARWYQYEPAGRHNARLGALQAFGEHADTRYRFDRAEVILALDADFLSCGPGHLRYARDFSDRRRVARGRPNTMSRLYVVECTLTITGAKADHRQPQRAAQIEAFARAVAAGLGIRLPTPSRLQDHSVPGEWVGAVVRDLKRHRGKSIVIAGDNQPPVVHALAHALNRRLGNVGRTVIHTEPVEARPVDHHRSLRSLVRTMAAGQVDVLLMIGGNPVYNAPADLDFAHALTKVGTRIHFSLYDDETSELCQWHVPEAHFLESWGDVRAFDGTVSIIQPLIAPLYEGKSAYEILALLTGQKEKRGFDIVRSYWKKQGLNEAQWRRALHDGLVKGSGFTTAKTVTLQKGWSRKGHRRPTPGDGLEIVFRPDPTVFDGRFANNGWLQELPKPLTRLTWDNAAFFSPDTAKQLGLEQDDLVELHYGGAKAEWPVLILPGHPDGSVTVHLGYGRQRAGRVGTGAGFNAYALQTFAAPDFDTGLQVRKTGRSYALVSTQTHHLTHNRHLIRAGTLAQYRKDPAFAQKVEPGAHRPLSLYSDHPYEGYKWGMSIDLNACTGCGACVIACQAENNIPVVGKDQVGRGRAMHWLRVDSYFKGDPANPETYFQPVPCMHCENAPCELVCPVGATVHSDEGLNDMVYNRCVGTRYCSNNCPYKVRRFNFLEYNNYADESLKLLRNPEVTVRSRGVMEKCTYCVQRINRGRIEAELDDRRVRDGEIQTACQAACPAGAIVFGDLNDTTSAVHRLHKEPRNYSLLEDQNTRPRTTYLAPLRNPNPAV